MNIIVGGIYTDLDDKDIVKVAKIRSDEIFFEVILDPHSVWDNTKNTYMTSQNFSLWYTPLGELAEVIYGD